MNYLKLVETYVTKYYQEFCDNKFTYHNINHVKDVIKIVEEIGTDYKLKYSEMETLKIAAWFHDIGHLTTNDEHEKISANIAKVFLETINYPLDKIESVLNCIKATDLREEPTSLLEKIIKDADLSHLGNDNYFTHGYNLYNEIKKREICQIDYFNWIKSSIKFFENHNYFTHYARKLYEKQKSINLEKLYSRVDKNTMD